MANVTLDQHFTYKLLIKAVVPSIVMMIFTSLYSIVDGLFISNFAGKDAFASVNFIFPLIMLIGGLGFMMGAGGSALVCKIRGAGDPVKANKIFGFLALCTLILGLVMAGVGIALIRPVAKVLGATSEMMPYVVTYGTIMLCGMPLFMLQNFFQSFLIAAERPRLGLVATLCSGFGNIIGDALLVGLFKLGIVGAASATVTAYAIGTIIPLIHFLNKKSDCWLKLSSISIDFKALGQTVWNGLSELVSNIAMSVVGLLYNYELLRYFGEDGVSAYGVIMYVGFIFVAIFIGYSMGVAPIISYNYGAQNHNELHNVFKKSLVFIAISSVAMVVLAEGLAYPISSIFVGYDSELMNLSIKGMMIYFIGYAFCGFSIFGSNLFTALNNGTISSIVSVSRTLVFESTCIVVLPLIFGRELIFASYAVAEFLSVIINFVFIWVYRKKYHY